MNESVELAVTFFLIVLASGLLLVGSSGFNFGDSGDVNIAPDTKILENLKAWILGNKWLVSGLIIIVSVVLVSKWTGIQTGGFTAVVLTIMLVLVGWLPVWVPIILGVLFAGMLVWMISR